MIFRFRRKWNCERDGHQWVSFIVQYPFYRGRDEIYWGECRQCGCTSGDWLWMEHLPSKGRRRRRRLNPVIEDMFAR